MLPNLFILNNTGDVLIEKHFLGLGKRYVCELFWEEIQKFESQHQVVPIITTENYYLINVRRSSLFFLTAIQRDISPLFIFETMHGIIDIFLSYFNDKITAEIIRENFSLVYQLLDEIIVGGFSHTTEMNQLTDMISPPTMLDKASNYVSGNFNVKSVLPTAFNNAKMPWRKPDCKYMTNEIKIDIVEAIDCIIQASNVRDTPVVSTIAGSLECNAHLSGQPDLELIFNNAKILDHLQLHRCVRILRWQKEKKISFVPPDGKFTLLKYRIPGGNQLPIDVHPVMALDHKKGSVKITIKKHHTQDKQIDKLQCEIPFPKETLTFTLSANIGKVTQDEITKVVKWNIGKFPKDKEPVLEGTVSLPSDFPGTAHPTVRVGFEIKGLSMSNLKVDSLVVHSVSYKPFKGVRHITKAGTFLIRS